MADFTPLSMLVPSIPTDNFEPAQGWRLYFFRAGTTTETEVYSDTSGTSLGTYVELNARGEPDTNIYLDTSVVYKIALYEGDRATEPVVWTRDNLTPSAPAGANFAWTFRQSATFFDSDSFSTDTTVQDDAGEYVWHVGRRIRVHFEPSDVWRYGTISSLGTRGASGQVNVTLDSGSLLNEDLIVWVGGSLRHTSAPILWLDVRNFEGAVGDGSNDDQPAFQKAADLSQSLGGVPVYVPPPPTNWRLDNTVAIRDGVWFVGSGLNCVVKGDPASASTYSPFEIYGDNAGLRDIKIIGSSDVDDSKGFTHVWILDEGGVNTPGNGPRNVIIERVHVEKSSNQGFAFFATTNCRLIDCSARDGKGHGFVFADDTDSEVRGWNVANQVEKTGGGSGKYGFDVSGGCVRTKVFGAVVENCTQGFKIEGTSSTRTSKDCVVSDIKVIGGANSVERAVKVAGLRHTVRGISIDGHSASSDSRVMETYGDDHTIDDIKFANITQNIPGIINEANNIEFSRLKSDASLNSLFRNNGGNRVKLDGVDEENCTTRSIEVVNNGAVTTDFTLTNARLTDDIVFDENTEANSVVRCNLSDIYSSGGGVITGSAPQDWHCANVHMKKAGSKPWSITSPTDVTLTNCTGDNGDKTDSAFHVTGAPTRLKFTACHGKNAAVAFNNAGSSTDGCAIIGCSTDNVNSHTSGFGGDTARSGNAFDRFAFDSVATDSAVSFTPDRTSGIVSVKGDGLAKDTAVVAYDAGASAATEAIGLGSEVDITTGALNGTTGTAGRLTISAHTDGMIYIENRTGATRDLRATVSEIG